MSSGSGGLARAFWVLPFISLGAVAQDLDRAAIFSSNKQMVVKIRVTGKDSSNNPVKTQYGSGVIVRMSGVIVTALHVIGNDADWAELPSSPNGRDRRIEVIGLDANGTERSLGFASAKPVPSYDVAILHITATNLVNAVIDDGPLNELASTVAIIWNPESHQLQPVQADLVPTDTGKYGDVLTVRLAVKDGNSGTGLFGAHKKLVGIITNKLDSEEALAVPAYAFAAFVPPGQGIRPPGKEVARCEAEERIKRVGRQPFSASNGVRCQNMGDTQAGVAEYKAPPDFTIVGQVQKRDETNYGTVGPVEYLPEGERIAAVRAALQCATPNRPFGPGGWSSTTLTGFIEKILSPSDIEAIRSGCLSR